MFIIIMSEKTQDVNLSQPHECNWFLPYSTEKKNLFKLFLSDDEFVHFTAQNSPDKAFYLS